MHLSEAAAAAPVPRGYMPNQREQRILDLREEGLTLAAIAARTGSSIDAVTRSLTRMRAAGATIPEPGGSDRVWSAERLEALRNRAGEGWSAQRVAEAIGLSRSAVLGKASRIGVKFDAGRTRSVPVAAKAEVVLWWTEARVAALRRLATAGLASTAIAKEIDTTAEKVRLKARALGLSLKVPPPRVSPNATIRKAAEEIASVSPPAAAQHEVAEERGIGSTTSLAAAPANAIQIHDLTGARCHWPFGDPRDSSFRYCGAAVETRGDLLCVYCARHREIAAGGQGRRA